MSSLYQSFAEQKIRMAEAIAVGCCEGTYAEGALILCSVISGMAAIAWAGEGKDRKRFVEIIIRFPPNGIDPKKISIPLLVQAGKTSNSRLGISDKFFYLTEANDFDEAVIIKSCPDLKLSDIRRYSYANLLYEQIRCGYAHHYKVGAKADDHDSLRQILKRDESGVSYINKEANPTKRVIYFPLRWIASVTEGVARGLDVKLTEQGKMLFEDLFLEVPGKWWVEG